MVYWLKPPFLRVKGMPVMLYFLNKNSVKMLKNRDEGTTLPFILLYLPYIKT
jgi:hypothetical protein